VGIAYDPEQGAKLLAEAGHPGGEALPELLVLVSGGAIYAAIYKALKVMWKENLGGNVSFAPMGSSEKGHITLAGVGPEYLDPDSYLRVNSWRPVTGWRNETFTRLVDEARRIPDWEERLSMYRQAEHLLIGELSLFPLTYGRFHSLLKPWVGNYPLNPLAIPNWKDAFIEEHRDKRPV
jgi:oligopeptide transport system substrate-binding protein